MLGGLGMAGVERWGNGKQLVWGELGSPGAQNCKVRAAGTGNWEEG